MKMKAEPCKLHLFLQLPAYLSLWLLWWECRKAVTVSERWLSPVSSVGALSDGSCQIWHVVFLRSCEGGWSQWELGLSQSSRFCWLVGWLSPACAGDWLVLFAEVSYGLSNSQEKSALLSTDCRAFYRAFNIALYLESLTVFSSAVPSVLGAFWLSLQQNFLYCGKRQICSNRYVERIYL